MNATGVELPAAYVLTEFEEVADLRYRGIELAREGAEEGTLLWAGRQSDARGRVNSTWICNDGDLHCGLVLRPDFSVERYGELYPVAAVSLGNALAMHLSPMTALGYHWPNAITIAGQRIAGIWLDAGPPEESPWLCLTLSVNILQAPEGLDPPAMSIADAEGRTDLDAGTLLESWAREFITLINSWSEDGLARILRLWHLRGEGQGDSLQVQLSEQRAEGIFDSLDDNDGTLILRTSSGETIPVPLARFVENDIDPKAPE